MSTDNTQSDTETALTLPGWVDTNPLPESTENWIDEPETAADRIARMMGEVGADDPKATVRVYRVLDGSARNLEFCNSYSAAEYELGGLKMIRETWGAGEYQMRLYSINRETGKFGIRALETIKLAEIVGGADLLKMPTSGSAHPDSALGQLVKMMADQQSKALEALQQRPDPQEQLMATFALLAKMKETMGNNGASQPAQSQQSTMKEMLETMRLMRSVGEEFGPPKDKPDDGLTSIIGPFAQLITAAMANQNQAPQAPQRLAAPQSAQPPAFFPPIVTPESMLPNPVGAESEQDTSINGDVDFPELPPLSDEAELAMFRGYLAALLGMAVGNVPIEHASNFVFNTFSDRAFEFLEAPGWFEILKTMAPDVAAHEAWLRAVRDDAMRGLDEEKNPQGQPK